MSLDWEGMGYGGAGARPQPSLVAAGRPAGPIPTWHCPPYSGNTELVSACQLLTSGF